MNFFAVYRFVFFGLFTSVLSPVYAAGIQEMSAASSIWKIVLSLIVVVAFIPVCLWVMKRLQFAQMKLGQSGIKVIQVQTLGPKERLMLVEVEGERILIGVTPNTITHLKNIPIDKSKFTNVMEEAVKDSMLSSKANEEKT